MVKRKDNIKQQDEPVKRVRKTKIKVDMSKLSDAVVDGKLVVPVGGRVYFERFAPGGKTVVHTGVIRDVNERGLVEIWDEIAEQFYGFSLNQKIPVIKAG